MRQFLEAYAKHKVAAQVAYDAFVNLCDGVAPARVPGCDTVIRLAWRIECGRVIEEAAAREYLYRWNLAIKAPDQCIGVDVRNSCSSIFGAPHTIGM